MQAVGRRINFSMPAPAYLVHLSTCSSPSTPRQSQIFFHPRASSEKWTNGDLKAPGPWIARGGLKNRIRKSPTVLRDVGRVWFNSCCSVSCFGTHLAHSLWNPRISVIFPRSRYLESCRDIRRQFIHSRSAIVMDRILDFFSQIRQSKSTVSPKSPQTVMHIRFIRNLHHKPFLPR